MSRTRISVDHVRLSVARPFDAFIAAFEDQLGRFAPDVYAELEAGSDPDLARNKIEAMAGPSGLMQFGTNDHGMLLRIVGEPRKALQYLVGNPLIAIEMTQHALGAALYAPLRVLIYEDGDNQTVVEYDLPSSLFGQFQDANVDRVAAALDLKLAALIAAASR